MSELIVMLTHNDVTVKDAKKLFTECHDLPVDFWGFKNLGLSLPEMNELVVVMKSAGKTTFLEVVTLSEEECLLGAETAVTCGFDFLLGTVFYPSVAGYCVKRNIKYLPFCGKVYGHPSVLEGTPDEIVADALKLQTAGCYGTDLLAYRNKKDPEVVIRTLTTTVIFPVVVAGSIDSFKKIDTVKTINPWAFTIGSALFEGKFGIDKSFRGQLKEVYDHMNKG
jgi:hypothetical protein